MMQSQFSLFVLGSSTSTMWEKEANNIHLFLDVALKFANWPYTLLFHMSMHLPYLHNHLLLSVHAYSSPGPASCCDQQTRIHPIHIASNNALLGSNGHQISKPLQNSCSRLSSPGGFVCCDSFHTLVTRRMNYICPLENENLRLLAIELASDDAQTKR